MIDLAESDHHGSHQALLSHPAGLWPGQSIDAIIVPTARNQSNLELIAKVAMALDCPLVTLHSGGSTALTAARLLPAELDLIAIDMPAAKLLRLPQLATSRLLLGTVFATSSDLSAKRNLALALSHLIGWSRILFVDDDIDILSPEDVLMAAGLLDSCHAVGFHIDGYPDNSVVGHAYRQAGGHQQSFVGGGALAVDLTRCDSFFPDIYNCDWFFLLDDHRLRPTATFGRVVQYGYDPFADPERARSEELGEVLGEGLYWLLDEGKTISDANHRHWSAFLDRRQRFITKVLDMVTGDGPIAADQARRIEALKASLHRLTLVTARFCDRYIRAWQADRRRWRRYVESLPEGLPLDQALARLVRDRIPPKSRLARAIPSGRTAPAIPVRYMSTRQHG